MTPKSRLHNLVRHGDTNGGMLFHPILMHFAVRFAGRSYREFLTDHRVLVESNVRCMERFGHNAVSVISDPYRETSAFGARIEFPEDDVPLCTDRIVTTIDDVRALTPPDVHTAERTRDRIEGVRCYRRLIGDSVPLIGWIEGPLAEACDLAGVNEIMLNLALDPDFVRLLMDTCMITAKDFARAQIEAGCDIMGVGDAICSQISPAMYEAFVLPLHRELFDYIHSLRGLVKLHICGDITHLLCHLATSGADMIDLDWLVDPVNAHNILGPEITLSGNLDPVSVIRELTADEVYTRAAALVEQTRGWRFILSGGCEITVDTPHANLDAMRRAAT